MKKLVKWGLKQALYKLALISFVVANVSPALAQTSSTYVPLPPAMFNNPYLVMQTENNLGIYGHQGHSLGQLAPGSVFETQFSRDPFHYVMTQPTLSYPAVLGTAMQMPTPIGQMIPGTLEQTAMLTNGMTLPANTNFYIPPAEFSYQNIRAIGARADSNDEDVNRLIDELIFGQEDEEDEEEDEEDGRRSYRSSYSKTYRAHEPKPDGNDYFTNTMRTHREESAPVAAPAPQTVEQVADAVISNTPFKILGPTCGCMDSTGSRCHYNLANHGRNMFKGKRKIRGGTRTHDGIDIVARTGTPIIASADGTVTRVMDQGRVGYGKRIDITHVDSFMTRYAHLSRWIVTPGQKVKKGQIIGYSGNTGGSSGAHLHFEVCKLGPDENKCTDANVKDPRDFMTNNGSNMQKQLNLSCTEAAALGGAEAPAASSTSSERSTRSSRAAQ